MREIGPLGKKWYAGRSCANTKLELEVMPFNTWQFVKGKMRQHCKGGADAIAMHSFAFCTSFHLTRHCDPKLVWTVLSGSTTLLYTTCSLT
eukprot:6170174-Amphidinium_carterae.1